MKQWSCNNGSLVEELRTRNQCQHVDCGLLWHEDLETCKILASFVRNRSWTKLAASFVETDNVSRYHKTCCKFYEQNFPHKDWYIQNLLQVLFVRESFVSRKDRSLLRVHDTGYTYRALYDYTTFAYTALYILHISLYLIIVPRVHSAQST